MTIEEKNKHEILSRIVAELSNTSPGSEELSAKIRRLREEIKKVIENEDTIYGKFRGLVESFREIIPEEKKRYQAAIKALTATSKLSQQEIVKVVNAQLAELKVLEKSLMMFGLPGWRDELKVMEAKSQEMKAEMTKLREIIARLENEEKALLSKKAAREKEIQLVEKAMRELFLDIGAEITAIKKKVEEFTAERAATQPSQAIWPGDSPKGDIPGAAKGGNGQGIGIPVSSAPQDSEWQKKCPMCGGRMNFYSNDRMWMCYNCAYEEVEKEDKGQKSEPVSTDAPKNMDLQKKCPACGGHINFHSSENIWMCYTCAYEESAKDQAQGTGEANREQTNGPKPAPAQESIAVPLAEMTSMEDPEPVKRSSRSSKQPPTKKKTCPVCRKKMNWYPSDKTWQCPFCQYERRI